VTRVMGPTDQTKRLRALGFRIRTTGERQQAIRVFKQGFVLTPAGGNGTDLTDDPTSGVGRATSAMLDLAYGRHQAGLSDMSAHFSWAETRCKCGGSFTACRRIWPTRASVLHLERLRAEFYPQGLAPASWCRCVGHNRAVGGASASRHLMGDGVDIDNVVSVPKVASLGLYGGIGIARSNRCASHVDNRPGSRKSPVTWWYGNQ
jgi:hypothetical protein